jgi:hypothetical protein
LHFFAVGDAGFGFDADLVGTVFVCGSGFVGEEPGFAVFAKAEEVAFGAERASGEVEEGVHFVGARGDLLQAYRLEAAGQGGEVGDAEFNFDFVHGESIAGRTTAAAS